MSYLAEMQEANITTTVSELHRLYGEYFEATQGPKPDVQRAMRAWIAYEVYARRYNRERSVSSPSALKVNTT